MLSTPHLLVGAAIVKTIPNPYVSLPLAFLSHFALDSFPHWDGSPKAPFGFKTTGWIMIDYFFGALLVLLLTTGLENQVVICFGAFAATLPDFIMGIYRHFEPILSKYSFIRVPNQFHIGIQRNIPFRPGLVVTAITSLISIWILLAGK